jgi:copper chaperone CopZ
LKNHFETETTMEEVEEVTLDESSSMLTTTTSTTMTTSSVRVEISGMTCNKCERLIREALLEKVDGVVSVDIFRSESFANVELKSHVWTTERRKVKSAIVDVIQELVNGKFKAKIRDDEDKKKEKKSIKKLGNNFYSKYFT